MRVEFNVTEAKKRILQLRKDRKLIQPEVAEAIGMNRPTYAQSESVSNVGGKRKQFFTVEQIVALKHYYGVTYEYLLEGDTSGDGLSPAAKGEIKKLKDEVDAIGEKLHKAQKDLEAKDKDIAFKNHEITILRGLLKP